MTTEGLARSPCASHLTPTCRRGFWWVVWASTHSATSSTAGTSRWPCSLGFSGRTRWWRPSPGGEWKSGCLPGWGRRRPGSSRPSPSWRCRPGAVGGGRGRGGGGGARRGARDLPQRVAHPRGIRSRPTEAGPLDRGTAEAGFAGRLPGAEMPRKEAVWPQQMCGDLGPGPTPGCCRPRV